MIRPPFRPPLTHHTETPAAKPETTAPTEPTGKICCGRPGCCGGKSDPAQNEHSHSAPGLNSGNGAHNAAKPGHPENSAGRA